MAAAPVLGFVLIVISALAGSAGAFEVDGTWSGTVRLNEDERKLILDFESSGTDVTGTFIINSVEEANDALRRFGVRGMVGRDITLEDMPQFQVSNGEMHGGVLVFDVELPTVVLKFVLDTVGNDMLVGSMERIPKYAGRSGQIEDRRARGRVTLHRNLN